MIGVSIESHLVGEPTDCYDPGKESPMLELTPEQASALERQTDPLALVNPRTQEVFVLVRRDVYNLTRKILKNWDDPEDADLIEQPHESR
jgi:hypothetical protein